MPTVLILGASFRHGAGNCKNICAKNNYAVQLAARNAERLASLKQICNCGTT